MLACADASGRPVRWSSLLLLFKQLDQPPQDGLHGRMIVAQAVLGWKVQQFLCDHEKGHRRRLVVVGLTHDGHRATRRPSRPWSQARRGSWPIAASACGAFQQIAARIGLLGLVADGVRERDFLQFARRTGVLIGPVAKRGSEPVNGEAVAAVPVQRLAQASSPTMGLPLPLTQNRCSLVRGSRSISFSASVDNGTRCSRERFIRSAAPSKSSP